MLTKLVSKNQSLLSVQQRAFRASAIVNKKPSIGDAVTILQSKVSNISQVVSIYRRISKISDAVSVTASLIVYIFDFK